MYKVKKETNMKSLEKHLLRDMKGKFTIEQLVNEGRIPKLFLKIEAVKKKLQNWKLKERKLLFLIIKKKTQS
jgi:hypothetical protein